MILRRPPARHRPSAPWLGTSRCALVSSYEIPEFLHTELVLAANAKRTTCHTYAPRGRLVAKLGTVVAEIQAAGYRLLSSDEDGGACVLVNSSGYVVVNQRAPVPLCLCTVDASELAFMRDRFPSWVRRSARRGAIYTLQGLAGLGLDIAAVGNAGHPLRRENYTAAALDAYDHALADLESKDPCGRLVLIVGPPGTGKTHLVRGMLAAVERARFVVVQAADIKRMLDADPLAALCSFSRSTATGRPIVLVVEDADVCLLPRGTDNLSQISALLNMSDGLVGAALDLRIVATSNARTVEIDPAITRAGRICRRIDVGPLEREEARRVLTGLLGRPPASDLPRAMTLAEAYALAREDGHHAALP